MLLSIGLMVKNEEKHLDECLNALAPILENIDSELIVVDTGSTDRTVEIAEKYTNRIYFHDWNNNFAEIRNKVLEYCSGEWFFCIDGDEVLQSCYEIIEFFKEKEYKKYNSATIYVKNLLKLNNDNEYTIFPAVRLFKKDKEFKFVAAIHNQPLFKQPIKCLNDSCNHYGYISDDKELMERKFERTSKILKNEIEKDPENIYYLYQMSVCYGMHKDLYKSIEYAEKAYDKLLKNMDQVKSRLFIFQQLCISYINIKDYLTVEKYAKEGLKYTTHVIDLYFYLGIASKFLKKNQQAMDAFSEYLKMYNNYYTIEKDTSIVDYTFCKINDVHYLLYEIYREQNDYEKAKEQLLNIKYDKYYIEKVFVELMIEADNIKEIKKYEENLINIDNQEQLELLYHSIESIIIDFKGKDKINFIEMFSYGNQSYNALNRIRLEFIKNNKIKTNEINKLLKEININEEKEYYGDLVYFTLYNNGNVVEILNNCNYNKINEYLEYISFKYDNFNEVVYTYISKINTEDFVSNRIYKEMVRYLVILNKLSKEKMVQIYDVYVLLGIKHVNYVYTNLILENELFTEVRNDEEKFFVYLNKAFKYIDTDVKVYISYLSKALKVYPYMKNVIKHLSNKEKQKISHEDLELQNLKKNIKVEIEKFIEENNLTEAMVLINEYMKIDKTDVDIYSMKAVILMMQENFNDAEMILKEGLEIECRNFDLLYNLGYIFECKNMLVEALEYYNLAEHAAITSEQSELIRQILRKNNIHEEVLSGKKNLLMKYSNVN